MQQAPACGVYISQLIRYSRACDSYQDFLDRGLLLTKYRINWEIYTPYAGAVGMLLRMSGISNQLRDIYSVCRCCWNVATYKCLEHSNSTCIRSIYLSVDTIFQTFICSNIPAALAYRVYISQLIRYSRVCDSYQDWGWIQVLRKGGSTCFTSGTHRVNLATTPLISHEWGKDR
jgi:hypothetical protein